MIDGEIYIERVEAVQFHDLKESGRTSPLMLTCEKQNAETVELVAKFATGGKCTAASLCAELISSQLAVDLGLPTPEAYLVDWDADFTKVIPDTRARAIVSASIQPAFGSKLMTNGFSLWPLAKRFNIDGVVQTALQIFMFDALIGNADRHSTKPNLLVKGNDIRIIDHELAFNDYLLILPELKPWQLGGFNKISAPNAHIFTKELRKHSRDLDFKLIKNKWAGLTDKQIDNYASALPDAWHEGGKLVAFATSLIRNSRDNIDKCISEARRVLNVSS